MANHRVVGFRVAAIVWLSASLLPLLGLSAAILRRPRFPLDLGLIHLTGRIGLLVTILPALVGLGGLVLLSRFRGVGYGLLALYSVFWAALALGALPMIWNADTSFCLRGLTFCISSSWQARLLLMGIAVAFLGTTLWSSHNVLSSRRQHTPTE
jgi:hypothetical protein